ncbi:GSCFA domain-containing protein [Filimonas effusa]|uniref:GSCFA domain-containing protein n=1 Tax=Filimonas effusa TaxID=2508721 RepID=A0A4Q1DA60_9BACT|nr:GSCFA domain-containing protein [Filimonas effusa]RXK85433.1 GSCFA domain-containing protein [Filimonas effusa]
MDFQVPIRIKPLDPLITHQDKLLLIGSCFTEHIGRNLEEAKFNVLQNPSGILFDPIGVCNSLVAYMENKQYAAGDLFELNEAWHSWMHHSRFSHPSAGQALAAINESQQQAHDFLKQADWLLITLGSSFVYKLKENGQPVVNCHKAPAQEFTKHLSTIEEIVTMLDGTIYRLFQFNPKLKIIFTISPVRHIRDGVTENNRSKARLIEAVHHLVNKLDRLYYFPAYELVIDVLRDYRFYDIDMVHPNYQATQFVLEHFKASCTDETARLIIEEVKRIALARRHRPFNPASQQHRQFLHSTMNKARELMELYPWIDFTEEMAYFESEWSDSTGSGFSSKQ